MGRDASGADPASDPDKQTEGSNRFVIEQKLGEGAMGAVYRAYDRERRHRVALKSLVRMDPVSLYHFKQEFRALAGFTHPNLVTLYELVSADDRWFFTMELIYGTRFLEHVRGHDAPPAPSSWDRLESLTLSQQQPTNQLRTDPHVQIDDEEPDTMTSADAVRPPAPAVVARLQPAFAQLATGLVALHSTGHLHRDIKPSNVLVTPEGRVVLLDFGVVARANDDGLQTYSDDPAGTPAYMAPEQTLHGNAPTRACDWYSFGVMLYEAITGKRPFTGSVKQMLEAKRKRDAPAIDTSLEGIAELCGLCERLLKRDPAARPTGDEVLAALTGETRAPQRSAETVDVDSLLVGRSRELGVLHEALAEAERGDGVAVFVSGESGMGKSALVAHFLREVSRGERAVILTGRCYEGETVPYKAVDSLVDSLTRYLLSQPAHVADGLMPIHVRELARVFPVLRRVDAVAEARRQARDSPLDPTELRSRAFSALREIFARIAARSLLVLFIDDLQWGDVDSAPLLADMMRAPAPPLLLLGSFRSEAAESSPFLRALLDPESETALRAKRRHDLRVRRLVLPAARELAERLLATMGLSTDVAELIARESGGIPFFVHEQARFAALPGVKADSKSLNIEAVLRARLDTLSASARSLLHVICVAAIPLPLNIIRRAAELGEDEPQAFAELRGGRWIRSGGSTDSDRVELYHQRMSDAVAANIDHDARRAIHRRIAEALETSAHRDPQALASHFYAAGQHEHALEYALQAAREAEEALAFDAAAGLYELALSIMDTSPDDMRPTRLRLCECLHNAGRRRDAARVYLEAAVDAEPTLANELTHQAAFELLRAGHIDEGIEVLQAALHSLGYQLAKTPLRGLAALLAQRLRLRLRGLRYRLRAPSLIAEAELRRIDACLAAAVGVATADPIRAADFGTRALHLSLRAGEPYRLARALLVETAFTTTRGTSARARVFHILDLVQHIVEETGDPRLEGWRIGARALAHYQLGEYRNALEAVERAVEIIRTRTVGLIWERDSCELYRLWALYYLGRFKELSERTPTLITEARRRGDVFATANLQIGLASIAWLVPDRVAEARARANEAMALWSQQGFLLQHCWKLFSDAQCDLYEGHGAAAYDEITKQWPALKRSMLLRIQILRVEMLHLRGRAALAAAAGTGRPRVREARRIARAIARQRTPCAQPMADLLRAGVASARGNNAAAINALERAERGCVLAHMRLFEVVARRARGQLLGGARGARLLAEAEAHLRSEGIVDIERMCAMLLPMPEPLA